MLDALLDSWDRNNRILVNLLRAIPADALAIKGSDGSPSIVQLFTHIHYVRMVFVLEDAPESAAAGAQAGGPADQRPGRQSADLGRLDAQDMRVER